MVDLLPRHLKGSIEYFKTVLLIWKASSRFNTARVCKGLVLHLTEAHKTLSKYISLLLGYSINKTKSRNVAEFHVIFPRLYYELVSQ